MASMFAKIEHAGHLRVAMKVYDTRLVKFCFSITVTNVSVCTEGELLFQGNFQRILPSCYLFARNN